MGEGKPYSLLVQVHTGTANMEISVKVPQTLKTEVTCESSFIIPGHILKEVSILSQNVCTPLLRAALLTRAPQLMDSESCEENWAALRERGWQNTYEMNAGDGQSKEMQAVKLGEGD